MFFEVKYLQTNKSKQSIRLHENEKMGKAIRSSPNIFLQRERLLYGRLDEFAELLIHSVSLLKEFLADSGIVGGLLAFYLCVHFVPEVIVEFDSLVEESAQSLIVSFLVKCAEEGAIIDESSDDIFNVLLDVSKIHISFCLDLKLGEYTHFFSIYEYGGAMLRAASHFDRLSDR